MTAMWGGTNIPPYFLQGRQPEQVVVLVDGSAHRAQGIVAVGEHVGQRKPLHPRSPGCLDHPHEGDVVGGHGVEFEPETVHVAGCVVGFEDVVGDGFVARLFAIHTHLLYRLGFRNNFASMKKKNAFAV